MLKNSYEYNNIFTTFLLSVAAILIYGIIKAKYLNHFDILQNKLGVWDLDGWSLTHVVLYFMLAYIYPKKWKIIFITGVIWEIIESAIGTPLCRTIRQSGVLDCWWYGKISDVVVNSIGIALALLIK